MRHRLRRHVSADRRTGQSLVEFALVLPVILLLVLMAIDFGRAFYSWVTITNSARAGANYAAINPLAAFGAGSEYDALVRGEGLSSLSAICPLPGGGTAAPQPTFADSSTDANATTHDFGDSATVTITCSFHILTPIVSSIVGNGVPITASSTFTIRTGPYLP